MNRALLNVMKTLPALGTILALTIAPEARAAISLELRNNPTVTGLGSFGLDLYAVATTPANELFGASQMILTWDTSFVQLLGLDNSSSPLGPPGASAFIPGDPFGLNASLTDGDALWNGFAAPGGVLVTPSGTLLTTFDFTALNPTVLPTLVDIPATGGNGGFTAVYDGTPGQANGNITGDLDGALVVVAIPGPGALAGLLCGFMFVGRRRARVA